MMKHKGTILIVEDNQLNSDMIKELLEEVGFKTLEAQDADTSLRLARQKHPDLILMDVYMPGKNGYQATRALKSDPETQDIPVLAFTSLAMEKDRQRAEAAGCIGLISKPIDVDTFACTVISYLSPDLVLAQSQVDFSPASMPDFSHLEGSEKEFIMKLSHDLQGPIRKINQFADWLNQSAIKKFSSEDQAYLKGIQHSTRQMQSALAEALMELSHRKQ
jgi:CheY-like chemotaxis protein